MSDFEQESMPPSVQPDEKLLDRLFGTPAELAAQRLRVYNAPQADAAPHYDPFAEGLDND